MIGRNSRIYFNMDLMEIHLQFFLHETAVTIGTELERNHPQIFLYQNCVRDPYRKQDGNPSRNGLNMDIHLKLLSKLKPSLMWITMGNLIYMMKLISH